MLIFFKKLYSSLNFKLRKQLVILFFLMLIGTILEIFGIALIVPVLYTISEENILNKFPALNPYLNFLGNPSGIELILYSVVFLSLIYLLKMIFLTYLNWKQIKFIYQVEGFISKNLFGSYLNSPYEFHLKTNSAILLRNVTAEAQLFGSSVSAFTTLLIEVLVLIGVVILLLYLEPFTSGSVIALVSVTSFIFYIITRKKMEVWGEARQLSEGLKLKYLQQGFGAIKDIKIYNKEESFLSSFKISNLKILKIGTYQRFISVLPRLWLEVLLAMCVALFILIFWLEERRVNELIPTIGLFLGAAFRVMPSFNKVIGGLQHLKFSLPAVDLVHNEMQITVNDTSQNLKSHHEITFNDEIEFNNISFHFKGSDKKVLDKINFKIKRSSIIGFVGISGAGKSTLINLILGLLKPTEGLILSDKKDINLNLTDWQKKIGFVPQNIFLIDDSLKCNIALGIPTGEIDEHRVNAALDAANLREFVNNLKEGINTNVGERGARISGGQQQRIGIARALYRNPEILILDEATSALDTETERLVMSDISLLANKMTIIMIAHRVSTLQICDKIYELKENKVFKKS